MVLRRYVLLSVAALLSCGLFSGEAPRQYKAKRVIILVIDGPRWTETWGEPTRKYIPHRATELAPQGVLFTNFANDGPTYTNAGHTALVTGNYVKKIDNFGKELPPDPTLFQAYIASGKPATDAWVIASKDKLEILLDSENPEWKGKHRASADCGKSGNGSGYREDAVTMERILKILPENKPHLVLVNFKEPDAAGHAKNWFKFLQGVQETDELAAKLWTWIQAQPDFANQTALFITNDHGRHAEGHSSGYVGHGDDCPSCHHIELLAMGPDFKKGAVVETHRGQIDIAATAAAILGVKLPAGKGTVLTELLTP
jgi:hypothetical protein